MKASCFAILVTPSAMPQHRAGVLLDALKISAWRRGQMHGIVGACIAGLSVLSPLSRLMRSLKRWNWATYSVWLLRPPFLAVL
jgi:hypothetical protein